MKILTKCVLTWTILALIVGIGEMLFSRWMISMVYDNPTRQYWQPFVIPVYLFSVFAIFIPWLIFTISFFIRLIWQAFRGKHAV